MTISDLVRKDMDVNEHKELSNFTPRKNKANEKS
jgi:hypothetical protein